MELSTLLKLAPATKPVFSAIYDKFIKPLVLQNKAAEMTSDLGLSFSKYYAAMWDHFSAVNSVVLPNQNKKLWELYIPLRVKQEISESKPVLIDSFRADFIPMQRKVLITETAGMGKSTMLKFLFLDVLLQNHAVPVFIELRSLRGVKSVEDYVLSQLTDIDKDLGQEVLKALADKGWFVFFFDGFDEVGVSERERVVTLLQKFINQAHLNCFVLSSRPDVALGSFANFVEYVVQPLKREEAYELLRRYDNTGSYAERIIEHVDQQDLREEYASFLKNPLLVSLLFKAYTYNESIPVKKVVFYRTVYDSLYWQHDHSKGSFVREKRSRLDVDSFHRILRVLGMLSITREQVEFTVDQLSEAIAECKDVHPDLVFSEADFISDLQSTVPVFQRIGDSIKWAHKSFTEYFAAQFIYADEEDRRKALSKISTGRDVDRFLGVLDFYKESDPKDFREIIILPILRAFELHMAQCVDVHSLVGVSVESVKLRCALVFGHAFEIKKLNEIEYKEAVLSLFNRRIRGRSGYYRRNVGGSKLMLLSRLVGGSKYGAIFVAEYVSGMILVLRMLAKAKEINLFQRTTVNIGLDSPVFGKISDNAPIYLSEQEPLADLTETAEDYDDLNLYLAKLSKCVLDLDKVTALRISIEEETTKRASIKKRFRVKTRRSSKIRAE